MVQRRSKTDKTDRQLPTNLLRIDQVPLSYVPPKSYLRLREVTRFRARLSRGKAEAKGGLRALLACPRQRPADAQGDVAADRNEAADPRICRPGCTASLRPSGMPRIGWTT